MRYVELVPAYGRDYKSAKAVRDAWADGQDFQIASIDHPDTGRYINRFDETLVNDPMTLNIRYKGLTQVCVISHRPRC